MNQADFCVIVGNVYRKTTREIFYNFVSEHYPYNSYDPDTLEEHEVFDDAYDWLLSNLDEALSVQVYLDDVLRINCMSPFLTHYSLFLEDASLIDPTFNKDLIETIKLFCDIMVS